MPFSEGAEDKLSFSSSASRDERVRTRPGMLTDQCDVSYKMRPGS